MTDETKYSGLAALLLGLVFLALFIAFGLPQETGERLVREGGVIESLSAALYIVVLGLFVWKFGLTAARKYWFVLATLLALALREMDAHKAWTTMSIFKSRFYIGEQVPVLEKLLGLAVIIVLIYMAYLLISRHLFSFLGHLRSFELSALAIFLAVACAVIAKSIDGIGRKLAGFGISFPVETLARFQVVEEVLELGIGLFLIFGLFTYVKNRTVAA